MFEASFREGHEHEDALQPERPEGDAYARYGHNLLPVEDDYSRPTSPVFNYPYSNSREALETLKRRDKWSPWHGLKMKYTNPRTGDYAIPTLATFIQLLPKGFKSQGYRSTDSTVFVCTEGKGKTVVGTQTFEWGRAISSSCRAGRSTPTKPPMSRSSSATPTAACRKSSASGANRNSLPDTAELGGSKIVSGCRRRKSALALPY